MPIRGVLHAAGAALAASVILNQPGETEGLKARRRVCHIAVFHQLPAAPQQSLTEQPIRRIAGRRFEGNCLQLRDCVFHQLHPQPSECFISFWKCAFPVYRSWRGRLSLLPLALSLSIPLPWRRHSSLLHSALPYKVTLAARKRILSPGLT